MNKKGKKEIDTTPHHNLMNGIAGNGALKFRLEKLSCSILGRAALVD
jgi:hypothetical protein